MVKRSMWFLCCTIMAWCRNPSDVKYIVGVIRLDYGDERLPQRFWNKVYPEPNTGCWLWGASTTEFGYGRWCVEHGQVVRAHRYILSVDTEDHPDLYALHDCDVPECVNPDHLHWGTKSDNSKEMVTRGRNGGHSVRQDLCRNGHEIRTTKGGYRFCPICRAARVRAKKKA